MKVRLTLRKIVAVLAWPFSGGYSTCKRCNRTWNICEGHSTEYISGRGCFPLCEQCWSELTREERLPYYMSLVDDWQCGNTSDRNYDEVREQIRSAVMSELATPKVKRRYARFGLCSSYTQEKRRNTLLSVGVVVLAILCIALRILMQG